jgi:hypothetical protein
VFSNVSKCFFAGESKAKAKAKANLNGKLNELIKSSRKTKKNQLQR